MLHDNSSAVMLGVFVSIVALNIVTASVGVCDSCILGLFPQGEFPPEYIV